MHAECFWAPTRILLPLQTCDLEMLCTLPSRMHADHACKQLLGFPFDALRTAASKIARSYYFPDFPPAAALEKSRYFEHDESTVLAVCIR